MPSVRIVGKTCVVFCLMGSCAPLFAQGELHVGPAGTFRAAGDGLTDDTAAIQLALNAVVAGGTVVLEPGRTFLVNLAVGLRPKSQSRLELHGATLRGPAGQGGRFIDLTSKTGVTIAGGTLLGSRNGPAATYGVLSVNSSDVAIEDVTFQDVYTDGVLVTGSPGGERVSVRGCRFVNGRRTGVYVAAGRHVSIESSTFESIHGELPEAGIQIQVNAGAAVEHVRIRQNMFRANGMAVNALKAGGTRLAHVGVTDNAVDGNGRGIVLAQATYVAVEGNRITGQATPRSAALVLGPGTFDATVAGNVLANNYRGIQADGASMVTITGNTIVGVGVRAGLGAGDDGDGITCSAPVGSLVSQCVISGNSIKGSAGCGIRVARGSYMIVSNNVITESGQKGISIQAVDDSQFRGNTISRSSLESVRGHDDIQVGAGARRNLVTLNQCRFGGSARASIYVDATSVDTLVAENSLLGGAGFSNFSGTTSASWDGSSASWNR